MTTETVDTPQYLYKILPLTYWQRTQSANSVCLTAEDYQLIHLAKEDQLENIIKKYWSDAPQFVILKLKANVLEGDLVYEANPDGTSKYYHLYNGFIPFSAIAESKIIYREAPHSCNQHALDIVNLGDPVLRTTARELSVEEILSKETHELIQDMKAFLKLVPGVGLAAPQIGKSIQLAVIEDMDHSHLTSEQIATRDRHKVPFHVIINPRLYLEEGEPTEFFEGCLSVPDILGVVPRAKSVRVECLNEKAEPVVIHAKGWYARILQHEIDHLNGTVFLDRAVMSCATTTDNYVKLWSKKSVHEIQASLMTKRENPQPVVLSDPIK